MTPLTASPLPGTLIDPLYPDGDGKPMAETPIHVDAIILLLEALRDHFAGRTDVCMMANSFMYYERGKTSSRVAPDGLVAKGVGNHLRRSFRIFEEGVPPNVTFEVCSKNKWKKDLTTKRELYARIGVAEYFCFDPDAKYLKPPLQGFRLENGASDAIVPESDGSLTSFELGVRLVAEGKMLRLINAKTGVPIPTREERIKQERKRAAKEKRRADALEAEVARLRKLLPPQARDE
jgi:Uma2 family endonuclease